jgi:hypothetical protein
MILQPRELVWKTGTGWLGGLEQGKCMYEHACRMSPRKSLSSSFVVYVTMLHTEMFESLAYAKDRYRKGHTRDLTHVFNTKAASQSPEISNVAMKLVWKCWQAICALSTEFLSVWHHSRTKVSSMQMF